MNILHFFSKRKKHISECDSDKVKAGYTSIEEYVETLKHLVDASPNGHLSLCHRIQILSTLGNYNTVNKVFLECAKEVYPEWKNQFPDETVIFNILGSMQSFLYESDSTKNKLDFLIDGDLYRDRLYEIANSEKEYIAGFAGCTVLSLAYNIAFDAELILKIDEYQGEDDCLFDWEGWNPDFYASMAYSGGNPFQDTGNIDKRKDFWKWYLDTTLTYYNISSSPLKDLQQLQNSILT